MKSTYNYSLFLLVFLVCQSCGSKKIVQVETPQKIDKFAFDFREAQSLSPILDLAAAEGKLVFLDLYTTWCLPCKMMDRDVFTHQKTADIINKDFISYKVDAEKANGPDLAFIYEIKQYPTLLFLDTKGRVLEKAEGALNHNQFIELAESAITKTRSSE